MQGPDPRPDLVFCRACGRHFRGNPRPCPCGKGILEAVQPFLGSDGDVIDERYELLRQIGIGGMGTVFLAFDLLARREVALKVLNARYAAHAASARRFFREARMMRAVSHQGAAALHRFGPTHEGLLLIDMEYVSGRSVREVVLEREGGLEVEMALNVVDNVLAALAACHDASVVHCDVKPENVVLFEGGRPGRCKLVDFGIAQEPGPVEHGDEFVVLGTPAFMSPEQVRCLSVDGRTDLYLTGCLAFELLTGEPPFLGEDPMELCQAQMVDDPPSLATRIDTTTLPAGVEDWIRSLLEKNPDRRPSSARRAREELRALRKKARQAQKATWLRRPRTLRAPRAARQNQPGPLPLPTRNESPISSLRALIEIRQIFEEGTLYGPKALQEIAIHVLAAPLNDLREAGAQVVGPHGAHIEVHLDCSGDERGGVSHLLDTLSELNDRLKQIPEPQLEIRAAVLARKPGELEILGETPSLELQNLLNIGPGSYIRCDAKVAKWAGRRQIVHLADIREAGSAELTTLYATSLQTS